MKTNLLIILIVSFSSNAEAQIKMEDCKESERFTHNYARTIDSTLFLSNNCQLTYSHNTLFKCIHITDTAGIIHLVDIRYRDDYNGYTELLNDHWNKVIFLYRGNGSGNPNYCFQISKYDGSKKWWGEYRPSD